MDRPLPTAVVATAPVVDYDGDEAVEVEAELVGSADEDEDDDDDYELDDGELPRGGKLHWTQKRKFAEEEASWDPMMGVSAFGL